MAVKTSKAKSKFIKHLYEFGPFRLDSTEHVLSRDGAPLPLTAKAIETLQVLIENSGHLVNKDELMTAVWPNTVVEENNLTQSVSALRKALGPEHPFIETVPRQGYRFVAMVRERREEIPPLIIRERSRSTVTIEEEPDTPTVETTALPGEAVEIIEAPRVGRSVPRLAGAALLLGVLVVGAYSLGLFRHSVSRETPAERNGIPTLAQGKYLTVLPFHALGDQASLHYLTEGLTEALTARLFHVKELHVVTAETGERSSPEKPLATVGRELGVNLVVAGMAQESGDKIQVVVSIQDLAGKRKLWTQEFSGGRQDLLTLQDQIFTSLVAGLGLRPSPEELARNMVHPTESAGAYDLYLKGRDALRGYKDAKDIEAAISLYQAALTKDPNFALAYAGLADASLEMYQQKKENFWNEKALHSAQEAVRLKATLAEAHLALGSVHYSMGENTQAIDELRKGLKLEPNSDEGYRRLGSAYLAGGQKQEAIKAYQKAIQLSPYYLGNYQMLGDAYLDLGENAKALETFRRIAELEPSNAQGYEDLGAVYLRQARWQDSIPVLQKALQLQPYHQTYSNLGVAYFFLKRYDDAVKTFEKAVELNPNEQVDAGNLADAYRWSGQKDKALITYRKAIELCFKELQVNPRNSSVLGSLALYYAKKGEAQKGLEYIHRARSYDRSTVDLVYIEAVVQSLAGRSEEALKDLREAFQRGYAAEEAKNDPELASLQGNKEFEKLTQQFGPKSR
jgi:tetratricopeptide (TPR) repeat protein/DNA-binding winged helix-turn-helix (wHTH) protein/TolB-like protein